jgi:Zn-dependent protease
VFEENENNYPVKPEHIADHSGRNRLMVMLTVAAVIILSGSFIQETYIILLELLAVLFLHECGHYLMMRFYGVKAQGMFLMSLFGGQSKKIRHSTSQRQQVMINLMGPLPGVLIGAGLFLMAIYSTDPNIYIVEVALLLLAVNTLNIIPLDPFDGGRIMEAFFFFRSDQHKMIFTLISSLVLILVGILFWFWPLIIFGFLMGLKVRGYQKSKEVHDDLEQENVNYKKEYRDLTNREYWKIRSAFLMQNPKLKDIIPGGFTLWENENFIVERVRQILRLDIQSDVNIIGKMVVLLVMLLLLISPVLLILSNLDLVTWYFENANY